MAVIYAPGKEPDNIKKRLNTLFAKIDTAYPDKVIFGLYRDHKKWSETVRELYRILGYENNAAFLNAYGYTVRVAEPKSPVGRQKTTDEKAIIKTLQDRYPNGASFKNLEELCAANHDFAIKKKTLSNNAMEYFGMTLVKYLKSLGLIYQPIKEEIPPKEKKVKVYHYFTTVIEGTGEKVYCSINARILHVGDFVEMSNGIGEEKIIGSIIEMNHDTLQEDLPIPVKEMYRYNRKITKKEMNDIEASKVKYIYCSVQLEGRVDSLYYISPFKDIQIGDIVEVPHNWYGNIQGVVVNIEHVSEKTASFSVKRTKEILRVVRSARDESEKDRKREEELEQKYGAEDFIELTVDDNLMEQYKNVTYFSGAVFRGVKWEIEKVQVQISIKAEKVSEEIYQFTCDSSLVPKIIEEYPNLKGIFFAENWKEGNVYLAYSESGYSTVTSFRLIGKCDFYIRDRWSLIHDPSENDFKCGDIEYVFEEKNDWEKFNYVVMDGKKKIDGGAIIPSKPYPKTKTTDPCAIIEIHYPENEIFYEAQQKSTTKVVTDKVIKNNNGKQEAKINIFQRSMLNRLNSIEVSVDNGEDKSIDGNLYSKDGTTLIQYGVGKTATAFTIPDSVTSIGVEAFKGGRSLMSVTIPDSVTSIGAGAFNGCSSLEYNVYDNAKYLGNANNPYVALMTASSTDITSCDIHNDTKIIYYKAFAGCSSLQSVTIPDSVTSISEEAFEECSSLTSVTIPDSVTSIGVEAFEECSSLTSVTIGNSVTSIGRMAFYKCSSMTSVTIGNSVTSIGRMAFSNCRSLTSVTIGNSVTSIGVFAFFGCSRLTSITFNGTVAQWNAISKGSQWIYNVHATKVVCSDGEVEL